MSDLTPEEIVEEAKKPGKFNILNALKDRAYPSDEVVVYLDEHSAYLGAEADERVKELVKKAELEGSTEDIEAEIVEAEKTRNAIIEKLSESAYIFTITGISEGTRLDILKKCEDEFPIIYSEEKNPITGEVKKTEIPDDSRTNLMMNLFWQAHIEKIVAPSGDVQDEITISDAVELRRALPIASNGLINQAIEKIRTATALFMFTVDEDFLAKS